jgi:hypothetical protein
MITSSHKLSTYSMIMARCMDVKKIMTKKRVILKFDSLVIC